MASVGVGADESDEGATSTTSNFLFVRGTLRGSVRYAVFSVVFLSKWVS